MARNQALSFASVQGFLEEIFADDVSAVSQTALTYSPDMNPIEMAFAKLKTLLRQDPQRTVETLWHRIGELLNQFTPAECANYLHAAGYGNSL